MTALRALPDFIVIGSAKSGTTSLHRWLDEHPDTFMSVPKEPGFFANRWDRGLEWYTSLFAAAPSHVRKGESSTVYTRPHYATVAATRMSQLVPEVRLLYLVRHPVERLLSHYRFAYAQGRVRGSLQRTIDDPKSWLVGTSLYYSMLEPYIERFDRSRLLVVRFEDLVNGPDAWHRILDHLDLAPHPRPDSPHNVTGDMSQRARWLQRIRQARRQGQFPTTPRWLRPVTRPLARRTSRTYRDPLDGVDTRLPKAVARSIWADVDRLEEWLGSAEPLWER